METIKAIQSRRSIRKYTNAPVSPEDLLTILDCGRLAPSGVNRQSWRFVVVKDKALQAKIAEATQYGKHIPDADVTIAVFVGPDAICPHEDASAATTCMMIAAHDLGYGTCWIGAHTNPAYPVIAKLLNAPEGYTMLTLFTLGTPVAQPTSPVKKSLEEVVSYDGF